MVGLGLLSWLLGGGIVAWRLFFASRAVRTEGTVTGIDPVEDFPLVTFTAERTAMGARLVTFRSNYKDTNYEIGQKLIVYYDPQNPDGATITPASFSWLLAFTFGVLGLVFIASAILVVVMPALFPASSD